MQTSVKPSRSATDYLLFLVVTLLFLLVYAVSFKGFNGTDDMHYSLLSARLLQNRFSPFVPPDVFCGRIALIAVQAGIYKLGGIGVLTAEAGTLACSISCCWLIIFKLAGPLNPVKTVLTATLFYFAPTLVPAIRGIMPDAYIMLLLVLLFLLWQKIPLLPGRRVQLAGGSLFGVVIAFALLFKESAILFIPLFVFLSLKYYRARGLYFLFSFLGGFACVVFVFGLLYAHYTGNFFFRATQIHNSQLIESQTLGSCNCRLDGKHLAERLTFGPWKAFILQGFLPVLMPAFYLLLRVITARSNRFSFSLAETVFLVLLFIILYFPANFQQYQPVCSDARQYLMLMPFGILVLAEPLYALFTIPAALSKNSGRWRLPAAAAILLGLIIYLTPNKWKWLTYGLWLGALLLPLVAGVGRPLLLSLCLLIMMAVTGLEKLFFFNDPWFRNLQTLHAETGDAAVYFPDHDNYIHWQFLSEYKSDSLYNLQPDPPPVFESYYSTPGTFRPGWFILDRAYTVCPATFIAAVDRLDREHFFSAVKKEGNVSAFRLDSPGQLNRIETLIGQQHW